MQGDVQRLPEPAPRLQCRLGHLARASAFCRLTGSSRVRAQTTALWHLVYEEFMDVLEALMDAVNVDARPPAAGRESVVCRGRVGE